MHLSLFNSSDPIDLLMNEHDGVLKHLSKLCDATNSVRADGYSYAAFREIVEAIRILSEEVLQHNRKEEKYLFPLLGHHVHDPLSRMREEHRELWHAFEQAHRCIQSIEEEQFDDRGIGELVEASADIVTLLGEHFAHEGGMIFPLAKQVPSHEEYEQFKEDIASSAIHDG